MMDHLWSSLCTTITIVCLFYGNYAYSEKIGKICEQVTSFDAVCQHDDILYILSAQPCTSKTSISITIINMKNASHYLHISVDGDTQDDPLLIIGLPGKGAVIIMKVEPASDNPKDYRQTKLLVELYLADIKMFRNERKRGSLIFEAKFPMFTSKCLQKGEKKRPPLIDNCNHGQDIGEFSTLCIVLPKETVSSSHIDKYPGVYMVLVDICTVPYSTTILAFMFSGYTVKETFTEDKTDKYIPVSPNQPKCGLVLLMHGHNSLYVHVKLQYGCEGGTTNTTIINHFHDTHKGLICPLSDCRLMTKGNGIDAFCSVKWIHSKNEQVEAHIELKLDICNPQYGIWWNVHVNEHLHEHTQTHLFPFDEHEVLKPGMKKHLNLGYPKQMHVPVPKTDGYMYLDWGTVSLFTYGTDILYVSVLRSYSNHTMPLFRTEFWLEDIDKEKVCPKKDTSLKTGLTLTGIGLVVFIVIVVVLYRRRARQRRSKGAGLPYKIHLAEELTQDLDMDDEVP